MKIKNIWVFLTFDYFFLCVILIFVVVFDGSLWEGQNGNIVLFLMLVLTWVIRKNRKSMKSWDLDLHNDFFLLYDLVGKIWKYSRFSETHKTPLGKFTKFYKLNLEKSTIEKYQILAKGFLHQISTNKARLTICLGANFACVITWRLSLNCWLVELGKWSQSYHNYPVRNFMAMVT